MNDADVRMECLRIAMKIAPPGEPMSAIMAVAKKLADFVLGRYVAD